MIKKIKQKLYNYIRDKVLRIEFDKLQKEIIEIQNERANRKCGAFNTKK